MDQPTTPTTPAVPTPSSAPATITPKIKTNHIEGSEVVHITPNPRTGFLYFFFEIVFGTVSAAVMVIYKPHLYAWYNTAFPGKLADTFLTGSDGNTYN